MNDSVHVAVRTDSPSRDDGENNHDTDSNSDNNSNFDKEGSHHQEHPCQTDISIPLPSSKKTYSKHKNTSGERRRPGSINSRPWRCCRRGADATETTPPIHSNEPSRRSSRPMTRKHLKACVLSYIRSRPVLYEMAFAILYALLSAGVVDYIFRMDTFMRPIPYQNITTPESSSSTVVLDPSLTHALTPHETFPAWLAAYLCTFLPTVAMWLVGFFLGPVYDAHSILCVMAISHGSTAFLTSFFKSYVGRLRPNFYSKCGYTVDQASLHMGATTTTTTSGGYGISNALYSHLENATFFLSEQELNALKAGQCKTMKARVSFPSGHSSFAFCGMTVLTLYLFGKIALYRDFQPLYGGPPPSANISMRDIQAVVQRASNPSAMSPFTAYGPTLPLWKRVACLFATMPLFLAMVVAGSRLRDNWHHPADVVAGSLIGMGSALVTYPLWYPSVFSPWAGLPLSLLHSALQSSSVEEVVLY